MLTCPHSSALRPDTLHVSQYMAALSFASSLPCHSVPCQPFLVPCADAISDKIEDLKKGRSDVLEVRRACRFLAA